MHKTQSVDHRAERPVDPKFSSIQYQAVRINEATNRLDSLIASLYDNLSSVLKDEKPMQVTAETAQPNPESSFASRMCVSADELEALCRRLSFLIDRLDI